MIMVIGPHRRKSEARAERATRDAHHERGSSRSRAASAAAPSRGAVCPRKKWKDDVPHGASRAARRITPRRRRAGEKDDGEHAKDEDAQRSEQALPADRYREGAAPSREP